MPRLTVALPVHRDAATLPAAAECLARQTVQDLDILLILNGSDDATRAVAARLAAADPRFRVHHLPRPNLAAALNHALREAATPYVARMDADDLCSPDRLERQLAAASAHLAALGTAFDLEAAGESRLIATNRPPTDPNESRWRLLISNPFAHGSMLLRRDAILEIGGYDESLPKAQDYDLWLRLARAGLGIAAIPEVLYTHRLRDHDAYASSPEQAACAATVLARAWSLLPPGDPQETTEPLARAMAGDPEGAQSQLEAHMTARGPTTAALQALTWMRAAVPLQSRRGREAGRAAHIRPVIEQLKAAGVRSVWLYGAGAHTSWLLPQLRDLQLEVAGIIDDALAGTQRHGHSVRAPGTIPAGDSVLLSSDSREPALWEASRPLREKGVRVHRLYAPQGQ